MVWPSLLNIIWYYYKFSILCLVFHSHRSLCLKVSILCKLWCLQKDDYSPQFQTQSATTMQHKQWTHYTNNTDSLNRKKIVLQCSSPYNETTKLLYNFILNCYFLKINNQRVNRQAYEVMILDFSWRATNYVLFSFFNRLPLFPLKF